MNILQFIITVMVTDSYQSMHFKTMIRFCYFLFLITSLLLVKYLLALVQLLEIVRTALILCVFWLNKFPFH